MMHSGSSIPLRETLDRAQGVMYATADAGIIRVLNRVMKEDTKEWHPADIHRARQALVAHAANLLDKGKAEEGKWTERDQQAVDGFFALIDLLDRDASLAALGASTGARAAGNEWVDTSGRPVRALTPEQNLADRGANETRFHIGHCMAAMVGGRAMHEVRNALSEGTDSAGGYTVPDILLPRFIDRMRARTTVIAAGARTVVIESDKVSIARQATDPVAGWRNENAAAAEGDPTFEAVTFVPRSLAVVIKVSQELLADSVNIADMLMNSLVKSFAVEIDRVALLGSGIAPEPQGLFNTSGINSVSMGVNGAALTNYDPLIDAMAALAAENSPEPGAAIMAPRTYFAAAKLKEASTNAPLALPAALAGVRLLQTSQVPINQTQGSASNASSILVGDWSNLMLGIRQGLRIQVLRETYAANVQVGFLATLRMDVQVAHPKAFAKIIGIIP